MSEPEHHGHPAQRERDQRKARRRAEQDAAEARNLARRGLGPPLSAADRAALEEAAAAKRAKKRAAAAQQAAAEKEAAAERAAMEERRRRTRLIDGHPVSVATLQDNIAKLLEIVAALPRLADRARRELERGATVPFWEVVDAFYATLSEADRQDQQTARSYANAEIVHQQLSSEGWYSGRLQTVPSFPDLRDAVRDPTHRIVCLVEEAFLNFEFAQIWELRRNTSAIEKSFAKLAVGIASSGSLVSQELSRVAQNLTQLRRSNHLP